MKGVRGNDVRMLRCAVSRATGWKTELTPYGSTATLSSGSLYASRIFCLENSLGVRMQRAAFTVRQTVKRNCIARNAVKYSGCSRKLRSCTVTTIGAEQLSGAVYCT